MLPTNWKHRKGKTTRKQYLKYNLQNELSRREICYKKVFIMKVGFE